jgi:hypothetical protein
MRVILNPLQVWLANISLFGGLQDAYLEPTAKGQIDWEGVMSSLWTDLLFLHGHISNADLARRLSETKTPPGKPGGQRSKTAKSLRPASVKVISQNCTGACAAT